jgi:hypothetical protein
MGLKFSLENSGAIPSGVERLNQGVGWYSQCCKVAHCRKELAGIRAGFEG